jgi:ubiquinone/menaquinone biosynthesis C-methylase UbiE
LKHKLSWSYILQENKDNKYKSFIEKNLLYYDSRSQVFNKSYNIFWSGKRAQEVRFETLHRIGNLSNKDILDVGCGYGDFFLYLLERGITPKKYVGLDINPEVIEIAKKHVNSEIAEFKVSDILKEEYGEKSFDYVFASGIFAFNEDNWYDYVKDMLKEMLKISSSGVGVNFLKKNPFFKYKDLKYNNSKHIYNFVKKYVTPHVVLKDNYAIDDFTLFLYKIE